MARDDYRFQEEADRMGARLAEQRGGGGGSAPAARRPVPSSQPATPLGTRVGTAVRKDVIQDVNAAAGAVESAVNTVTAPIRNVIGFGRDAGRALTGQEPRVGAGQPAAPVQLPRIGRPAPSAAATAAAGAAGGARPTPLLPLATPTAVAGAAAGATPPMPPAAPGAPAAPPPATFQNRNGQARPLPPGITVANDENGNQVFSGTGATVAAAGAPAPGSVNAQSFGGPTSRPVVSPLLTAKPDAAAIPALERDPRALAAQPRADMVGTSRTARSQITMGLPQDELIRRMQHVAGGFKGSPSARQALMGVYADKLAGADASSGRYQANADNASQTGLEGAVQGEVSQQDGRSRIVAEQVRQQGDQRLERLRQEAPTLVTGQDGTLSRVRGTTAAGVIGADGQPLRLGQRPTVDPAVQKQKTLDSLATDAGDLLAGQMAQQVEGAEATPEMIMQARVQAAQLRGLRTGQGDDGRMYVEINGEAVPL